MNPEFKLSSRNSNVHTLSGAKVLKSSMSTKTLVDRPKTLNMMPNTPFIGENIEIEYT